MPEVSVIVATRDRLDLLKDAVASVEAQSFADWELVVVDDASTDGTSEWLSTHSDPRIRHIRSDDNIERSAARNRGVATASGTYLVFLDDDDRLLPRALERLHGAAMKNPAVVGVVGGFSLRDSTGNRRRASVPRRRAPRSYWRDSLFGGHYLMGRALVLTEAVRRLGGFDESLTFAEDWELWLRLSRCGAVVSIPDVVYDYFLAPRAISLEEGRHAMRLIAEAHIASLGSPDVDVAERMVRVRAWYDEAIDALSALRFRDATRAFVRSIKSYPAVLSSPVVRPQLLRGLGKACVGLIIGRRGSLFVRRGASLGRRAMRRNVWTSVRLPSDDDETNVC